MQEHRRISIKPVAWLTSIAVAATLIGATAQAQDATWSTSPGTADYNTAANWTPATVPTGTATFGLSNGTALSFSADTSIHGWTFNAGASAYAFTNDRVLKFSGAGIVINGGSATITNNNVFSSIVNFLDTSTAGNATITNNIGGGVVFSSSST
jgi:hypothetical protein